MAARRHLARIAVMQVLFERQNRDVDVHASLKRCSAEHDGIDDVFADSLLRGVLEQESRLRDVIIDHVPGWTFETMDPIARCILLIGAYELLHTDDAPPAVVMNECVEIAKEYGNDETPKFVNGVLNALAKKG